MAGFEVADELSVEDVGDNGTKLSGDCRARPGQRGTDHSPWTSAELVRRVLAEVRRWSDAEWGDGGETDEPTRNCKLVKRRGERSRLFVGSRVYKNSSQTGRRTRDFSPPPFPPTEGSCTRFFRTIRAGGGACVEALAGNAACIQGSGAQEPLK